MKTSERCFQCKLNVDRTLNNSKSTFLSVQINRRHRLVPENKSKSFLLWRCHQQIVVVFDAPAAMTLAPTTVIRVFALQAETDLGILLELVDFIPANVGTSFETLHSDHFIVRLTQSVQLFAVRCGVMWRHCLAASDHLIENRRPLHSQGQLNVVGQRWTRSCCWESRGRFGCCWWCHQTRWSRWRRQLDRRRVQVHPLNAAFDSNVFVRWRHLDSAVTVASGAARARVVRYTGRGTIGNDPTTFTACPQPARSVSQRANCDCQVGVAAAQALCFFRFCRFWCDRWRHYFRCGVEWWRHFLFDDGSVALKMRQPLSDQHFCIVPSTGEALQPEISIRQRAPALHLHFLEVDVGRA